MSIRSVSPLIGSPRSSTSLIMSPASGRHALDDAGVPGGIAHFGARGLEEGKVFDAGAADGAADEELASLHGGLFGQMLVQVLQKSRKDCSRSSRSQLAQVRSLSWQ